MRAARSSPTTTGTSRTGRRRHRRVRLAARPGLAYRDRSRSGGTVMRGRSVHARACGGNAANRPARLEAAVAIMAAAGTTLLPVPALALDGAFGPAVSGAGFAV